MDTRRKPGSSIKDPKEVDSRRDIDLLFEDMDIQDLNQMGDAADINKLIQMKKRKMEQNSTLNGFKNKRVKISEGETAQEANGHQMDDKEFEIK